MSAYPWTDPNVMPLAPVGEGVAEWGIQHQKSEHFSVESQSEINEYVANDLKGEINYGWSPNDQRMQPIERIAPEAVLSRDHLIRRHLFIKELLAFFCSIGIVIGALYAVVNGIELLRNGGFFLIFFAFAILETGFNDFFVHRWENRQHETNPSSLLNRRVANKLFMTWLNSQSKYSCYVIPAVCVALFVLQWSLGMEESFLHAALIKAEIYNEPFRLITCGFLHGGPIHLGFNALIAYVLCSFLCPLIGVGRALFIFMFAILTGSLLSWWWSPVTSVGASGGILGLSGALVGIAIRNRSIRMVGILGPQVRWICLLGIIGLIGAGLIDNAAHLGGFIGGLCCGVLFAPSNERGLDDKRSLLTDPIALLGVGTFVCTALFLALKLDLGG